MDEYGKIFRKYSNDKLNICMESYNPDVEKYHEVILRMKAKSYKQVIINSELMIEILNAVIMNEGYILGINFTDNTDENLKIDVKNFVLKIRKDRLQFINLKELLKWALDNNSIDIFNIELYYNKIHYTVYSNGLIMGNKLNLIFEDIIEKVLDNYLS
ncbi:hypothetical protein [Peribacillus loiseleuriae]|uniref:Uncharacterized protein n=1 Tax=Peribacillus loiseleuriae TaxID=1679170 RepID=A0A0K9GSK5_9BACI|nr:hypothetical protein [Peribacillus loiseleuriae]KMY49257.1 hypothetical protein AC625_06750 [Peribacillus loiseleuriae]